MPSIARSASCTPEVIRFRRPPADARAGRSAPWPCCEGSRRPLIVAGGGVLYSQACEALARFAEQPRHSGGRDPGGKSSLPWDHPLNLGAIGVTGRPPPTRWRARPIWCWPSAPACRTSPPARTACSRRPNSEPQRAAAGRGKCRWHSLVADAGRAAVADRRSGRLAGRCGLDRARATGRCAWVARVTS
jgi:hypothetical protein